MVDLHRVGQLIGQALLFGERAAAGRAPVGACVGCEHGVAMSTDELHTQLA